MKDINTIIFDLNGTIYEKGILIDGVKDTLNILREQGYNLLFVTNTDGRSIQTVYNSLMKMGLDIKEEELFTPISAIKEFINKNTDKTFYPLVNDDVVSDFNYENIVKENPDYVIVGSFEDRCNYKDINKVFRMIHNGAEIITTSKTLWYIGRDGENINTGSFVSMFETACNKEARLFGKPSKRFLELALNSINSKSSQALIIGDDIKTDILGGTLIGATTVLVETGIHSKERLDNSEHKPHYIIKNVNNIIDLLNKRGD